MYICLCLGISEDDIKSDPSLIDKCGQCCGNCKPILDRLSNVNYIPESELPDEEDNER